jgi:hypothetical protein
MSKQLKNPIDSALERVGVQMDTLAEAISSMDTMFGLQLADVHRKLDRVDAALDRVDAALGGLDAARAMMARARSPWE